MKNRSTPPRLAMRFFRWYCHPRLADHIEGDLIEVYLGRVKKDGQCKADWKFMIDVLMLFRPGIIGPLAEGNFELINTHMIRNYLLVAFRNLVRHRLFATINIMGLSLGVTVCVLIMLFVTHEMSYDSFHKNEARIFQLHAEINYGGQVISTPSMSAAFGPLLANATADVRNFVRMRQPGRVVVHSHAQHKSFEDAFIFADSSFFSVFSFQLLEGSKESLGNPGKVFITPQTKQKYFGTESAIGKFLIYQNKISLEVAGIVAPAPSNSSIRFDFIASFSSLGLLTDENESEQYHHDRASLGAYPTYILLNSAASAKKVEGLIPSIANITNEKYFLEPFPTGPSNIGYLKIFASIAALVLILALVNYMNLTTARATTRAKEVGVRKVIGASRSAISSQFYVESALVTILSFAIAYFLVSLSLPYFEGVAGQSIDAQFLSSPLFLTTVTILLFVCIFLAGSYPAIVLSRFNPVAVLKGKQSGAGSGWLRKGLTGFQFTVSVTLITCSLVIQQQLEFLRNQKIGMNKDQVMVVNLEGMGSSFLAFRNETASLSGVSNVGQASVSLFKDRGMDGFFCKTPKTNEDVFIYVMTVDPDFFKTLGIQWHRQLNDSVKPGDLIINESALGKLRITEDNLGEKLMLGGETSSITGIVKDFNYASLKEKINGVIMYVTDPSGVAENIGNKGALYVRLNATQNVFEMVEQAKQIYNRHQPTAPFEYYFLDDAFNNLYQAEDRLAIFFKYFTGLAICIACLGLLGLVTFTTEKRRKEIGIRTILGASVRSVLMLISREFVWIVIPGVLVAAPVAWLSMDMWLRAFPYRITLSTAMFVTGGSVVIALAFITIWIQAAKAAGASPVNSLRSE